MAGHFLIVEANFYKDLAEAQKKRGNSSIAGCRGQF